ncbi:MAG: ABC transporter ATP-binding protein [Verrucomicrobiae bacterium]|nr:ABC transporter ATP-binding protein [Verrucomicrobiae bacterium]
MPLLEVQDLRVAFAAEEGVVRAVDGVSFTVGAGETVALVGESGSGKSVTALALTRLLPSPPARFEGGRVLFEGKDTLAMTPRELRSVRGARIAYVFQEPSTSLNPVFRVRTQVAESLRLHRPEVKVLRDEVLRLLDLVGIRDPSRVMEAYPHQLSGGMQQRVMIAMALACRPALLVADEPTTALDVTVQAQILDLLRDLRRRLDMAVLLITHNFAIVSHFADRVLVMYRGRLVEQGGAREVLRRPRHAYTAALLDCIPRLGIHRRRLSTINHAALEAAEGNR